MPATRVKWPAELTNFVYQAVLETSKKYNKFTIHTIYDVVLRTNGAFLMPTIGAINRERARTGTSYEALASAIAFRLNTLEKHRVIQRASHSYREWRLLRHAR